jgi:hypothetical protein
MIDGKINIENLKVFAFMVCRGENEDKVKFLYDLIW